MADAAAVVKDQVFSFEIARRAVGRAALHLGIDSMTEQALDVMADVLLEYLSRTGQALSHLVESSRRTSAHVNVLDAFQACQFVTSPAVGRLHLQDPEEEDERIANPSDGTAVDEKLANGSGNGAANGSASATQASTTVSSSPASASHSSTGWKGLAAFVFGPKWLDEKDEEEYLMEKSIAAANAVAAETVAEGSSGGTAGGKVFPSSIENGGVVPGDLNGGVGDMNTLGGGRRRKRQGWDAPFTDKVSLFPRASATCANPHALPSKLGLSSAKATTTIYRKVDIDPDEAAEEEREAIDELEALPDNAFAPEPTESDVAVANGSSWGSIDGRNKRKLDQSNNEKDDALAKDQDGDVEMKPATKKVKIDTGKNEVLSLKNGKGASSGDKNVGPGTITTSGEPDDYMPEEFLYVPAFYPRPPSTKVVVDDRRTVVDGVDEQQERLLQQQRTQEQQEQQISGPSAVDSAESTSLRNAMNMDSFEGVRTSLVRLGGSYWGSGWDRSSSSAATIAVPMGRKVGGPTSAGGAAAPDDPIVPMSRASGSRVSRVLEGSMDAAAMQ